MIVRVWLTISALSLLIAFNVTSNSLYPDPVNSLEVMSPQLLAIPCLLLSVHDKFKAVVHLAFGASTSLVCISVFALHLATGV